MTQNMITSQTVKKMANLSRIQISDGDMEKLASEMGDILNWIQQLDQVDTTGVDPLSRPMSLHHEKPSLRADENTQEDITHLILANAPEAAMNMFAVPKVVE